MLQKISSQGCGTKLGHLVPFPFHVVLSLQNYMEWTHFFLVCTIHKNKLSTWEEKEEIIKLDSRQLDSLWLNQVKSTHHLHQPQVICHSQSPPFTPQ